MLIRVIKTLAMESYADAMILTPGESMLLRGDVLASRTNMIGLNTEQRRRLTIALELVARPELLLFLDMS